LAAGNAAIMAERDSEKLKKSSNISKVQQVPARNEFLRDLGIRDTMKALTFPAVLRYYHQLP
jgi:hypothetical protein